MVRVLLVLLVVEEAAALCPQFCQCLWRSSKITVDCGEAGLTSLPENVESVTQVTLELVSDNLLEKFAHCVTQVLNMTGASLPNLHSDQFTRAGLPNLQRLFLRSVRTTAQGEIMHRI